MFLHLAFLTSSCASFNFQFIIVFTRVLFLPPGKPLHIHAALSSIILKPVFFLLRSLIESKTYNACTSSCVFFIVRLRVFKIPCGPLHLWVTFLAETSKNLEIILIITVLSFTSLGAPGLDLKTGVSDGTHTMTTIYLILRAVVHTKTESFSS